MPELPDVELYLSALRPRIVGRTIERVRVASPFFVRSYDPPVAALEGRTLQSVSRLGKRIVFELDGGLFVVIHLMIAGRFRWKERGATIPAKVGLAAFDFPDHSLLVTEAGSRKQASLHVVRGRDAVDAMDPGGVEIASLSPAEFAARLTASNHTLKRMLTDPHVFSGIGNAYSDEILHAARLSPARLTQALSGEEIGRLFEATRSVLAEWTARLQQQAAGEFPEKVTAFHKEMAVHGRFGAPCPRCGAPVQRIVYARNEANYCAPCQTDGRLLADRALSRLLREDWPRTLDALEQAKRR